MTAERTDGLAVLLAPDLADAPWRRWLLVPSSPESKLMARLRDLVTETGANGRLEVDLPAYVTAMHALVLDLVELTGAATNGRKHSAHRELLEHLGLTGGPEARA